MAPSVSHVDFALAVGSWLAGLGSANTRDAYRRDLERYIEWWQRDRGGSPLDVTSADVEAYRDDLVAQGLAPSTVARRLSSLGSFLDHAVDSGTLPSGPDVPRVDRTPTAPVRTLTQHEAQQLWEAGAATSTRHLLLIASLLLDDIRLGELLAADTADVEVDEEGGVSLDRGRRGRVRLHALTAAIVRDRLDEQPVGPLLLAQGSGQRLTRFGADYLLRQASARAGIDPPVSASALRRLGADRRRDG